MGLSLDHGGHLTHGSPVNFSNKLYEFVPYTVDRELELIDYDEVRRLAQEHRPKIIVSGATAYTRTIEFDRFREIADEVDAILMADIAHIAGLIAAGEHPSPDRPCPDDNVHDSQDAERRARRHDPVRFRSRPQR